MHALQFYYKQGWLILGTPGCVIPPFILNKMSACVLFAYLWYTEPRYNFVSLIDHVLGCPKVTHPKVLITEIYWLESTGSNINWDELFGKNPWWVMDIVKHAFIYILSLIWDNKVAIVITVDQLIMDDVDNIQGLVDDRNVPIFFISYSDRR